MKRKVQVPKLSLVTELVVVKAVISVTFVAWWIHPAYATPMAILGNLIWLWLTPVLEDLRHGEIHKEINALKREVEELRAAQ